MNELVIAINARLQKAATQTECQYIDVDGSFENHRLCDISLKWFQWKFYGRPGIDLSWNFGVSHPNLEGQRQYAARLAAATGCKGTEMARNPNQ